jgi:hypothetical protein
VRKNEAGDYFPVLGISLGFQLLMYLASKNVEHRTSCYSYEALPLEFKRGKMAAGCAVTARHTSISLP